jgi:gamma-glutamyl hercynylcysteine S-oxide synthase
MVSPTGNGGPVGLDVMPAELLHAMEAVRDRTLALVAHLSPADLERQVDPLMSPLVWDLAHIAAYEDLWLVHRFAGAPLLRPDLAARYDAFETPRTIRGEIELLDAAGASAHSPRSTAARRTPSCTRW